MELIGLLVMSALCLWLLFWIVAGITAFVTSIVTSKSFLTISGLLLLLLLYLVAK